MEPEAVRLLWRFVMAIWIDWIVQGLLGVFGEPGDEEPSTEFGGTIIPGG